MSVRNLQYLFAPRSVAVIGASERPGSVGASVLANVLRGGFKGPVYAVNPRHAQVAGLPCHRGIASLPQAPELALVCTPPHAVPGVISELGARGTRAAIVMTAGLDVPAGRNGPTIRQAMLEAARPYLLRILGPNCVGMLAPGIGLNASFAPAPALPGRLAMVSQSGAMVTAVLDWAAARNIGFSSFISLGDCADIDAADAIDYLAGDRGTDAILLYLEGIGDARKFMSAARAAARCKPTLILKSGRFPAGAQAAATHTGALAGADRVCDAAIRRAGMLRVYSTEELFEAVEMLARPHAAHGRRLMIVTNGGGPAVMAADALSDGGGELARLGHACVETLAQGLPSNWSCANPVDIIGDAPAQRYVYAMQALLADADSDADAILLIHAPTAIVPSAQIARALAPGLAQARRPVLCCWMGGDSVAEAKAICRAAGLPVFSTPEAAVAAFLQLSNYAANQCLLMEAPPARPDLGADAGQARALLQDMLARGIEQASEADTKALLALYGIPTVPTRFVRNADEALLAADAIGYPVAVKVVSPDVSHKTDVGGVVLDVADAAALHAALDGIARRLAAYHPGASLAGYAVERMVRRPHARELIVGVATDPVFGPVLLFGHGGTDVEAVADQAIALPPLNRVLSQDLISRTRVARLLAGVRGAPPADSDALCDVLLRVAQMAIDLPELVELDINPLLADSDGVLALDARMRLAPAQDGKRRLAIVPYPHALEQVQEWRGGPLLVRPIRPEDAQAHLAFFQRLTPEDVHFRMFDTVRELTPAQLARFTQIDYAREMALIALRPDGETLGVARLVADPDHVSGEFAVIVRSDLKRQGLGRLLMARLIDYGRDSGLREMVGEALPDNQRLLAMVRALGFTVTHDSDGTVKLRLILDDSAADARPGA